MYNLVGLVAVALIGRPATGRCLRLMTAAACACVTLSALSEPLVQAGERRWSRSPSIALWPQQAVIDRFDALWRQATGAPLRIVGGDLWVAGLLAVPIPDAEVFTDLDPAEAPWITPDKLHRRGLLVVWRGANSSLAAPAAATCRAATSRGVETFRWSSSPDRPPISIDYCIVPPETMP